MQRIRITATDAGYYNTSPLGDPLAPNVFLKTAVNIAGLIESTDAGWQSLETARYTDFGVDVAVDTLVAHAAPLGTQTQITVTGLEYYRVIDGVKILTGALALPTPLSLTATYDQLDATHFGWRADMGTGLQTAIQHIGVQFLGGEGDDIFKPATQIFPMYTDSVLRGHGGNDTLYGGLGNDRIYGGSGNDIISDADGQNGLLAGSGNDVVWLGNGSDGSVVHGGTGNDTLVSGAGNDTLIGNAGRDSLSGGAGNDILQGLLGRDTLDGGRGADIIDGGKGNDMLHGGDGADRFVFRASENGFDTVSDFNHGEDILAITGLSSFGDLTIIATDTGALVEWGYDAAHILLENVDAASLGNGDFLFQ